MTDFEISIVDLLVCQSLFDLFDVLIVIVVEHVLDFLCVRRGGGREGGGGREEGRREGGGRER